jgi:hypothetical protein
MSSGARENAEYGIDEPRLTPIIFLSTLAHVNPGPNTGNRKKAKREMSIDTK